MTMTNYDGDDDYDGDDGGDGDDDAMTLTTMTIFVSFFAGKLVYTLLYPVVAMHAAAAGLNFYPGAGSADVSIRKRAHRLIAFFLG